MRAAAVAVGIAGVALPTTFDAHAESPKRHDAEAALLPANAPPPPPPTRGVKGTALVAVYDEGFRLRTNDGANDLRFVWSGQLDGRIPMGESVAPVSLDIRRARLDLIATISRRLFVRIGLAAEDTPYLRNAFGDLELSDLLHVRVGQLKVPFSTEWATFDNQVNFVERAHAQPIHPFLDRGILLWGKLPGAVLTYNLGLFAGAGVDTDAPRGDIDDGKEIAFRLFAQPFRNSSRRFAAARGFYFVTQGTWEDASQATRRFELRGTISPTFESNVWSFRGPEKASLASKARFGGELHYLFGPLTLSAEASTLRWTRLDQATGSVYAASAWASVFLTGESKLVDNFGWRQPNPRRPFFGGGASSTGTGLGAVEVLGRASMIDTDESLFSVFKGARRMNELTFGLAWTLAYAARLQLNVVHTWNPSFVPNVNGIVSGASSEVADASRRNVLVPSESLVVLRAIFRI